MSSSHHVAGSYYFPSSSSPTSSGSHDSNRSIQSAVNTMLKRKAGSYDRGASISSLGSGSSDEEDHHSDAEDVPADEATLASSRAHSISAINPKKKFKLTSSLKGSTAKTRPPRLWELLPSSLDLTADHTGPSHPIQRRGQRHTHNEKVCYEERCCGRYPNLNPLSDKARGKARAMDHPAPQKQQQEERDTSQDVPLSFQDLFWKRQVWLMENRGADGLSHCSEDEGSGTPTKDSSAGSSKLQQETTPSKRLPDEVLRTAGAGLPLARVKRVMKGADEAIKMISHESPSLLSRLCTVLVADLTMRAGRNAVSQQRRTISNQDFLDVTVGQGEGAGAEWEFLRDVVETAPTEE